MNAACQSYPITIYMAGDLSRAEQVCREYCMAVGLCVTAEPTKFIYTGGEELGVRIGLINYPKYPGEPDSLLGRAKNLANLLREELCQYSWSIVTPDKTYWDDLREVRGKS